MDSKLSRWLSRRVDDVWFWTSSRRLRRRATAAWLAGVLLLAGWVGWPAEPRPVLLLPVALVAAGGGGGVWLAYFAAKGALAWRNHRYHQERRRTYVPPRTADGAVDWSALEDYVAVAEADSLYPPHDLPALLAGPLSRYFELCADESGSRGMRARTMEFARGAVNGFKRRRAWWWGAPARVDAAVAAELEARFRARDLWLIEVYQGLRSHHATGPV